MHKLSAIRRAGGTVQDVHLTPLDSDSLAQLVSDALHSELQLVTPLAQLIHEKTAGNPFSLFSSSMPWLRSA